MSDPIDLPLDEEGRLADPPLIDSLHYEKAVDGFSVIFVPSMGEELTQTVFVARDSGEAGSFPRTYIAFRRWSATV